MLVPELMLKIKPLDDHFNATGSSSHLHISTHSHLLSSNDQSLTKQSEPHVAISYLENPGRGLQATELTAPSWIQEGLPVSAHDAPRL